MSDAVAAYSQARGRSVTAHPSVLVCPSSQERSECGQQGLDIEGGRADVREGDAAG